MISFIPLQYYYDVIAAIILIFIGLLSALLLYKPNSVFAHRPQQISLGVFLGSACFLILLLLISLRPISYAFGDMGNYYKHFLVYKAGAPIADGDLLFEFLLWFFASYLNAESFFFLCAFLYLVPLLVAARRALGRYWPLAFLFAAAQYDFYGYAVNGLRQGIASSLFLMALTYRGLTVWIIVVCAIGFHKSFILPAIAYAFSFVVIKPKFYLGGWFAALLISSLYAGLGEFVSGTGLLGEKFDIYLNTDLLSFEQFSTAGFRLDFIAYSLLPIFIGFYFLIIKRVGDEFYTRLFSIYLMLNAAWLLVIRVPSSNRFAYLSWGLMGFVIAYPLIKFKVMRGQHALTGLILLFFYLFTFISHL